MQKNAVHEKTPVLDGARNGAETAGKTAPMNLCGTTVEAYPQILVAIGRVKKACALTNKEIGALDAAKADAIIAACDGMIAGRFRDRFPQCAFGGFGSLLNIAANEFLAGQANEILAAKGNSGSVCPNTHVNMGQSSNDVLKTAKALAVYDAIGTLLEYFPCLEKPLADKAEELKDVVKLGRTSYRDAVPVTLGQEFSGYLSQIRRNRLRLEEERGRWNKVPLGATVLGTGLGCMPGYFESVCGTLSAVCGREIVREDNLFDAMQSSDAYVMLHAQVQSLAICAAKIGVDIRLMASGPRAGLGEITLRAVQQGSSIMPGKLNPVIPHMVFQISQRISANHAGIAAAASSGELDLGSTSSVIFKNLLDSMELIGKGMKIFGERVISGVSPYAERCRSQAERSLGLSVVAGALFGHRTGKRIALIASEKDITCKEAAVLEGLLSQADADALFDVSALTDIHKTTQRFSAFLAGKAK